MLIVQKYGGTSLADTVRMQAAARRVVRLAQQGAQIIVVVSAQGHTTDELIKNAQTLNPKGSPREMAAYLACAEQMSAALMAMTIGAMGEKAVSLTGWQAGLATDAVYDDARPLGLTNGRIRTELARGNIVVVTGFQGVYNEDITTLGRGGSDTTAVALAAYLKADLCQIFTDVDGVYDRDPRRYTGATRFGRIGYDRMLQLAQSGAQVLHDRCVQLAREHGIVIEVLSAFTGAPGTLVGP